MTDGKADTNGIAEGTREARGVLRVANELTGAQLEQDVGLATEAAMNIEAYRLGDDGAAGTADDEGFDTLAELDAIPFVGPIAFAALLDYAAANQFLDDNSPATANPLSVGEEVSGTIEIKGDRDWFAVELEGGRIYKFALQRTTLGFAPDLDLFDRDGAKYLAKAEGDLDPYEVCHYEIAVGGIYYLRVRDHFGDGIGSYTISVTDAGVDDHGDDSLSASPMAVGTETTGMLETYGDNDWFAVELVAGRSYRFVGVRTSPTIVIDLRLYDRDGTTLVATDDYAFLVEVAVDGVYYLRVRDYFGEGRGTYAITVNDLGE